MSFTMRRGATLTLTAAVLLLAGCGGTPAPAPTTVTVQAPAPAALGAASSDAPGSFKTVTLPDVVGQNGAIAQDALRRLGLTKIDLAADATSGKQLVFFPENWHVTKIEPAAGTQVHTNQAVVLTMTK
jgi:hypothetical protein